MQTPSDYLRALLLELAEKQGLSDSAIQRAYVRAGGTIAVTSIQRFRTPGHHDPPSEKIEEAYAAATGTTREQNWNEAVRRWKRGEALGAARRQAGPLGQGRAGQLRSA